MLLQRSHRRCERTEKSWPVSWEKMGEGRMQWSLSWEEQVGSVCVDIHVWMGVHVHVGTCSRDQRLVQVLYSHADHWPESPRDPPVSTFPALGSQVHIITPGFVSLHLSRALKFKHRSSHLHTDYYADWAFSPALRSFLDSSWHRASSGVLETYTVAIPVT